MNEKLNSFLEIFSTKYDKAMKSLAHESECQYRISVYETTDGFIGLVDLNRESQIKGNSVNEVILLLKERDETLRQEYGVKYFPLGIYYDRNFKS